MLFLNRYEAGRKLAAKLEAYKFQADVLVLALPRGGVPVGYEVAKSLSAPMDVFIVRKLGVPGHEEFAMGALASGGVRILDNNTLQNLSMTSHDVDLVVNREEQELKRREKLYRGQKPPLDVTNKLVILVDDGLATGLTMRAAVLALQQKKPRKIIVATPVGSASAYELLKKEADEVVCLVMPEPLYGVGMWYLDFAQTSDEEVSHLLSQTVDSNATA